MQINRQMAIQIAYVQVYIFHMLDVYVPSIIIRNFRDRLLLKQAYDDAISYFNAHNVDVKIG